MNHKQEEIVVNNTSFMIDIELKDTILLLNQNGWKTSGCCIGDYKSKDEGWMIIQTSNENNIIRLMRVLDGCCYNIEKRMYWKSNKNNTLYMDYLLKIPASFYDSRCEYIKDINKNLMRSNEISDIGDCNMDTMDSLMFNRSE